MKKRTKIVALSALLSVFLIPLGWISKEALADHSRGLLTIMHYFTGDLGRNGINQIFSQFQTKTKITVFDNPVGHENFKEDVRAMAKGKFLPDVFSYWAGARTQSLVDDGHLLELTELWKEMGLEKVITPAVVRGASDYGGKRYLVPFGFHVAGFFYNPRVLNKVGISEVPRDWKAFLEMAERLKKAGIRPFALGSKYRWPAQFWFDYLLVRTAGVEFRSNLMKGRERYDDKRVAKVMEIWKSLLAQGLFNDNPNDADWTDAADQVMRGEAAMTLMGTWVTGYWNKKGLIAAQDYDFFPFPEMAPNLPSVVVGPVDGLVISKSARDPHLAAHLVAFMAGNKQAQTTWAKSQGALSANILVEKSSYNKVLKRTLSVAEKADHFIFNYDLATSPEIAEAGLTMFQQFLVHPESYGDLLSEVSKVANK